VRVMPYNATGICLLPRVGFRLLFLIAVEISPHLFPTTCMALRLGADDIACFATGFIWYKPMATMFDCVMVVAFQWSG
jgi:hypothetical protein